MEIYILRHGEAEPRGPGVVDENRALTKRGRRDVRLVAEQLRDLMDPELILTSPLRRARETADEVRPSWPGAKLEPSDLLKPDAQPAALWKDLQKRKPRAAVLVGHEPHLSHWVAYLLNAPVVLDFKKGGMLRIDADPAAKTPKGVLKWLLTPKLAKGKRGK